MKGVLGLICMLAVTMAAASAASRSEWDLYKEEYGKVYEDPEVDRLRRLIYESNVQLIERHNARHAKGLTSYTMAVNAFSDQNIDRYYVCCGKRNIEHNKQYTNMMFQLESEFLGLLGYSKETPTSFNVSVYHASGRALPESVDWRAKGYVTPVKYQGHCGSCWTFSATGAVEGQHAKKSGKLLSLSEQQILDCDDRALSTDKCPGGDPLSAFDYIRRAGGIETERSYPYVHQVERCKFNASKVVVKVTGAQLLAYGSEQALQEAIAFVGPISVAIDSRAIMHYHSGIFDDCPWRPKLDHAVLAVGYGSQNGDDYYIVKNSWGIKWGSHGYMLLQRNRKNQCGIANFASFPTVQ